MKKKRTAKTSMKLGKGEEVKQWKKKKGSVAMEEDRELKMITVTSVNT